MRKIMQNKQEINKVEATDKLQYPVIKDKDGQKKTFVQKMFDVMKYQQNNTNEISKSAFYSQDATDQQIKNLQLNDQLFKKCSFYTTKIVASVFAHCTFLDCNFSAATLFNVKFQECTFRNCNFTDAEMQDVNAETSQKVNCLLKNIKPKNVKGFESNEDKIIEDSFTPQINHTDNSSTSYENVKEALEDWQEVEPQCFELCGQDDDNCGLAIYPNSQKNTEENTDMWEFVFFYGNEALLTSEYNLYNLSAEEIEEQIEQWKSTVLIEKSGEIMQNLLNILDGE